MLLMIASVVVKVISAIYKIPLTSYIGATGRGYFNIAYNLYMPVHAVIMGAFPVALTHLISKYSEQGNKAKIYALKKASGRLFFIIGVLGMVFMFVAAKPYTALISSDKSAPAILVLAPTVLFSSMAASKRAFAEGHMNMVPTSVSQVLEAVFKMVFGLLFAKLSMSYLYNEYLETSAVMGILCASEEEALSMIYPMTSAAAIGGVTVGAFLSLAYTSAYVSVKYKQLYPPVKGCNTYENMREIISFSIPIIAATLIQSISEFVDHSSVQYCLSSCDVNMLKQAYAECIKINNTSDADIPTYIFGLFSSAHDLKNLVPGFTMALGVAAVPAITSAYASGDKAHISSLINSIFKYTSIVAFAGGFFLSLNARYMLEILYGNSNYDIVLGCTDIVRFYGFTMILFCLSGASVFCVQSIGCASKSIPSFIVAAVIRVALNFILVSDYRINIYGAAVSDSVAYVIILVANMYVLAKNSGVKYSLFKIIVKPLFCAAASYFITVFTYNSLFDFKSPISIFVVLSIINISCFTLLAILSKTVEFSELKTLQHCKKLA